MLIFVPKDTRTILFFGKTGSGKSTTQNALFGLRWDTDASVACTKEPQLAYVHGDATGGRSLRVIDMPGIAESIEADDNYLIFYQQWLPLTDCLVWITQADTRAYKRDQTRLVNLLPYFRPTLRLVVAINRVDDLGGTENEEPLFDRDLGLPSESLAELITEKTQDVFSVFSEVIGTSLAFDLESIVPYTARYGWGLSNLHAAILK